MPLGLDIRKGPVVAFEIGCLARESLPARSTATSTYCGISSIAWHVRPVISAAMMVVPEPSESATNFCERRTVSFTLARISGQPFL